MFLFLKFPVNVPYGPVLACTWIFFIRGKFQDAKLIVKYHTHDGLTVFGIYGLKKKNFNEMSTFFDFLQKKFLMEAEGVILYRFHNFDF